MKVKLLLLPAILFCSVALLQAQTDKTSLITNPSFEDNIDDLATGWTYEGGADTMTWHTINMDGDATKTDSNICGLWNAEFADVAISQTLTGLDNGVYKVTADLTVGTGGAVAAERLTTQRIFANDSSVLYSVDTNYSSENLSVLTEALNEKINFAGYQVSAAENGPFLTCEICTEVTDGTLKLGIKTNGTLSAHAFSFPDADASGWGWFKVDNFTLTLLEESGTSAINNSKTSMLKAYAKNGHIIVEGVKEYKIYSLSGLEMNANRPLNNGIYLVKSENKIIRVLVK